MSHLDELFISVDVEASGPIPGEYSLLTIGACLVDEPEVSFYCQIKPINENADPKAIEVSGLSLESLREEGMHPVAALESFDRWIAKQRGPDKMPVFVGFNAGFDWSFINYYFHYYLGRNPFGFTALDIKAFYMGATGVPWGETRSSRIAERLKPATSATHNALDDAKYQAELFRLCRKLLR